MNHTSKHFYYNSREITCAGSPYTNEFYSFPSFSIAQNFGCVNVCKGTGRTLVDVKILIFFR
jgi:hypothetical protein